MTGPDSIAEWSEKITHGDRSALAQAITLVESTRSADEKAASQLLETLSRDKKESTFRLGVTGAPGAGKSSLIEHLGVELCKSGRRVAVLAIDPSSSVQGGSILGDQARMEKLSQCENAFIRASPSSTSRGGITLTTEPVVRLCEAAGFDFSIIETVGSGQNELGIRDVADAILLLIDPCGGDGFQAIKKGLLEFSDFVAITKADGSSLSLAESTFQQFSASMPRRTSSFLEHSTELYLTSVFDEALSTELLSDILEYEAKLSPHIAEVRKTQAAAVVCAALRHLAAEWAVNHPHSISRRSALGEREEMAALHPVAQARSILGQILKAED